MLNVTNRTFKFHGTHNPTSKSLQIALILLDPYLFGWIIEIEALVACLIKSDLRGVYVKEVLVMKVVEGCKRFYGG